MKAESLMEGTTMTCRATMIRRTLGPMGLILLLVGALGPTAIRDAHAEGVPGPCHDFVTGGGWFLWPAGTDNRSNFGFNAGYKSENDTTLQGQLNYIGRNADGSQIHVQSTSVTVYDDLASNRRVFAGEARINQGSGWQAGYYTVVVWDFGEPGRCDRFIIEVRNGEGATVHDADSFPELEGGNIQIHKPCKPCPECKGKTQPPCPAYP
jgi:hypothetical protein